MYFGFFIPKIQFGLLANIDSRAVLFGLGNSKPVPLGGTKNGVALLLILHTKSQVWHQKRPIAVW
jgi:hypothetical protein